MRILSTVNPFLWGGVASFITGIAGSPDDSFLVETSYWNGASWKVVCINNYKTTGFLSLEQCQDVLNSNSANIETFDDDPERFLKRANDINKTLHNNGIAVGDRAKVMGALLLALADDGNLTIHRDPTRMMQEVNGSIEATLRQHGKEDFRDTIKLTLPATGKNHQRFRKAIVETLQHLREMNVRSAINSGDDALGKFYETFLKYANGAKEMGIVLTPRHITKLAVDVLGITCNDKVFDPTCGTGGFLVSAMDYVRENSRSSVDYNKFKKNGIWGVENDDPVYGLALVNMIFRGDGKSGLQDGSCFDHQFWGKDGDIKVILPDEEKPINASRPFSKVLMNPPFSTSIKEIEFVDYALNQCKPRALLFAILPYSIAEGAKFSNWRKETMKRHRIRALLKLDKNLFYPIAQSTYAFVLEAHIPHDDKSEVFMSFVFDDDSRPRLSKVISKHSTQDNTDKIRKDLHRFLLGKPVDKNIPKERIVTRIDLENHCSFAPEAYIDNKKSPYSPDVIVRTLKFREAKVLSQRKQKEGNVFQNIREFSVLDFVRREVKAPLSKIKDYPAGNIPVISATAKDNGIESWKDIPSRMQIKNLISISKTHNTMPCQAFWHPYIFSAINTVILIDPVADMIENDEVIVWFCQSITEVNAWRYDYSRTVQARELKVFLPVKSDGSVDFDMIIREVRDQWKNAM